MGGSERGAAEPGNLDMENLREEKITERICVYGIVQGVGFRPFVSRLADRLGVAGSVANRGSYVEIYACGDREKLASFREALKKEAPDRSVILKIDFRELPDLQPDCSGFRIAESGREEGDIFVSPDIAVCPECRRELYDPSNRRYLHPFINCTSCGPRLTILDSMPYDRERTSMGTFQMCPDCEYEYTHPETRRYHAQPVCCNHCGPEVYLIRMNPAAGEESDPAGGREYPASAAGNRHGEESSGRKGNAAGMLSTGIRNDASGILLSGGRPAVSAESGKGEARISERGPAAITAARRAIAQGRIVAVKGIGGFHLCCDASNEKAVERLRERKHRPAKPFAVMMRDLEAVERECVIPEGAREILDGPQKPILLLRKREESALAPSVAPGNPNIGVMLPYAPLQMLLFQYDDDVEMTADTFVMTSGNISGAPICRTDEDALRELSGFCDIILSHDREIRMRSDDSVMDFFRGEPYMVRRSRGFAPLPCMLSKEWSGQVIAVGGELKNTFCIGKDRLLYLSPHIGDMGDLRTERVLEETIRRMETLFEARPQIAVCDLHPGYRTGQAAEKLGLPLLRVQHHYAHVLSCMAENDFPGPVIGVSFDGTGYGTDGTVWGGEFLIADYGGFERAGSIRPFRQAGGDASAREGWRIAASMLYDLYGEEAGDLCGKLGICEPSACRAVGAMADRGINTVKSTSAGRLFDAVSALLGLRRSSTFEGEAAQALQFAAESYVEERREENLRREMDTWDAEYGESFLRDFFPGNRRAGTRTENAGPASDGVYRKSDSFELPTDRLFARLTEQRLEGQNPRRLAFEFHFFLAEMIADGVRLSAEQSGLAVCALSGGVFQNKLLLALCTDNLESGGFKVLQHHLVPPNDGGLALGQAAAAMAELNRNPVQPGGKWN